MPMRGELPVITARLSSGPETSAQIAWSKFLATISTEDFQSVAIFSLIGLLLTINLILWIPDIGAYYGSLDIFP